MTNNDRESLLVFLNRVKHLPWFENVSIENLHTLSPLGDSLMHSAAILNLPEIVNILEREGLDVNQKGEHGYTPLDEAIEQENQEAKEALVALGGKATGSVRGGDGVSP